MAEDARPAGDPAECLAASVVAREERQARVAEAAEIREAADQELRLHIDQLRHVRHLVGRVQCEQQLNRRKKNTTKSNKEQLNSTKNTTQSEQQLNSTNTKQSEQPRRVAHVQAEVLTYRRGDGKIIHRV